VKERPALLRCDPTAAEGRTPGVTCVRGVKDPVSRAKPFSGHI